MADATKLRPEVVEALRGVRAKYGPGRKPTRTELLALVELGVRLALLELFDAHEVGAEMIAKILQAQPEVEGE